MLPCQEVIPDMGSASRQSPEFLAGKLKRIREALGGGLSQEEMVSRLGLADEINRTYISKYEAGVLEPPLKVLLRYAEVAGVYLEVLADDRLDLPEDIPCVPKSHGVRKTAPQRRRRTAK
jgi:transcriptional regulator with XRE-family HTH domain